MSKMSSMKSLGKGELVRRLVLLNASANLAKEELQRWMDGFVTACAYLKIENHSHPFVKSLVESTAKLVDEKIKQILESQKTEVSNGSN